MIRQLQKGDADIVAQLHLTELRTHFHGWAGQNLLACYYRVVADCHGASGYVCVMEKKEVLGFVCGIWNKESLSRTLFCKEAHKLLFWGVSYLIMHPRMICNLVNRLQSFFKIVIKKSPLLERTPQYELRPIVVKASSWGNGISNALLHQLLQDARIRGFYSVKLLTEIDNNRANAFYKKSGFQLETTIGEYNQYRIKL